METAFSHPTANKKTPFRWAQESFAFDDHFDLINVQSNNRDNFSLSSTAIEEWIDYSISRRHPRQRTAASKPTYSAANGSVVYNGSSNTLIFDEIERTEFSMYFVFRNTGALTKILFGALNASDYCLHNGSHQLNMNINAVQRILWDAGVFAGANVRYHVFSIRRKGPVWTAGINDRILYERLNTYPEHQATLIARLMTYQGGGFFMAGEQKAVCGSSRYLSDEVHTKVIDYLYTRYCTITTAENICGFGDSNTVGQGATSYLVGLASSLGLAQLNIGIAGTRLTNVGQLSGNGFERWKRQIVTRPGTDYVSVQYGTNDVLGGIDADVYAAQYAEITAGILQNGYLPGRFLISTVPYQLADANAALIGAYNTRLSNIAVANGVKIFDLYTDLKNNGGDANLSDSVHLNTTGQTRWQNGAFTALTT